MHDVGKVSVPAEILSRPSRLSALEFELVKTHVEAGYAIVSSANLPGPVAEIVYQHHERLDGSGYPRGLHAPDLLLGSRVLMVADVVEAMCSHRPYRPSFGLTAALDEIAAGSGNALRRRCGSRVPRPSSAMASCSLTSSDRNARRRCATMDAPARDSSGV